MSKSKKITQIITAALAGFWMLAVAPMSLAQVSGNFSFVLHPRVPLPPNQVQAGDTVTISANFPSYSIDAPGRLHLRAATGDAIVMGLPYINNPKGGSIEWVVPGMSELPPSTYRFTITLPTDNSLSNKFVTYSAQLTVVAPAAQPLNVPGPAVVPAPAPKPVATPTQSVPPTVVAPVAQPSPVNGQQSAVGHAASPIISSMNKKCIDVPNGNFRAGVELKMWDCQASINQQFEFSPGGEIKIGGLCVDALGGQGNLGDRIGLWVCNGGKNQKWYRDGNAIKGVNNRCIDIAGGNQNNGASLALWDCHGGVNQGWNASGVVTPAPGPAAAPIPKSVAAPAPIVAANKNLARYTPDPEPGKIERCFGAVGNGCEGGPPLVPPAGNNGGVRSQWVNVGSIAHDNCCRVNPNGQHCKGHNAFQEGWGDQYACVKEWRKAVYNWRDQRSWPENFGPYQNEYAGDDLKEMPARKMRLFSALGAYAGSFSGNETVSTRKLKAPSGTALDIGDEQFCASGKFRATKNAPLGGMYGICK